MRADGLEKIIPIMLPHRGRSGGPGWNGRCTSGVFSPGRVTQGVKAIPLYPAKGNRQSQTSSLGRPRSTANNSCTLLLYHESLVQILFIILLILARGSLSQWCPLERKGRVW
ncbi:hypothetical protein AVEN_195471-1 [Araneus ventricosus]|uniref:Uncharacterized protein n=1 Tax=Araneus ventricosus TaxID=182803 RepID=A0A4Y2T1R3_ARAVE|nr:hypothetical protein AVEN_195471-1 [Araneus ventricosus]